jgi:hypothetical protein
MTKLEFQTKLIYVIVEVENPKSRGEIYGVILEEYGKKVADECMQLYDKHKYLID